MKKKQFLTFFKKYVKTLLDKLQENGVSEEEISKFKKQSQPFAKFLIEKFDSIDFFLNEKSNDCPFSAMGIALWINDADSAPTFYYLKHGLNKVKF